MHRTWRISTALKQILPNRHCCNLFPTPNTEECTEAACKMEHGRTQTVLIDESAVLTRITPAPSHCTPLSGPFALINACWPDGTWKTNTPHLVRQALSRIDWRRFLPGFPGLAPQFFSWTRCHLL